MKHFFIKAFLASLFFILTSANFALAQESQESFQDWKNRMLKNHPHEEWIVGFGQCEAREKHASDKAQDMATLSAARNISVKTRQYTESGGYAKRVLTSNSDDEYIHRIDASFCSVSSEVDMVNIRYETHRYDGSVYAFAYISRKDYVDWLQREIKDCLGR